MQEGAGEDLLMLHGYLSCKESFYYQIKYLSRFFSVTAPDIIGFGKSGQTDFAYGVSDYANWLKEFIVSRNIKNPKIIAHSFGARVALKYISGGGACERLILTGGAGIVKPRSKSYIRKVKAYRRIKKLFPRFAEKHFGSEEYKTLPPIMKESYKKIVNEDLSACAKCVRCPTLLIYGRDDKTTPYFEEGKIFNSLIEESRLEVIDGGHFCFSDNADIFNELAYNFLTER